MFSYEDQTRSRVEGAIREGLRSQYAQRGLKGDRKPGSKVIPMVIFLAIVAVIILGACAGKTSPDVPAAPNAVRASAFPSQLSIILNAHLEPFSAPVTSDPRSSRAMPPGRVGETVQIRQITVWFYSTPSHSDNGMHG